MLKRNHKKDELGVYIFSDWGGELEMTIGKNLDEAMDNFSEKELQKIREPIAPLARVELTQVFKRLEKYYPEYSPFKKIKVIQPPKIPKKKQREEFINELKFASDNFIKNDKDKEALNSILSKV